MSAGPSGHFEYLLRLGDNALILGQRLSEWCGHGPILEEDIALANIALDLIGQARLVLSYAARVEGRGRDEDALAFLRDASEFRNCTLAELPNRLPIAPPAATNDDLDFAVAVVRIFLFSSFQSLQWQMLGSSVDDELSAIAMKSLKESRYHEDHAAEWLVRLGDGTAESRARVQRALAVLWPYTAELFVADDTDRAIAASGVGVDPSTLQSTWMEGVAAILERATLSIPPATVLPFAAASPVVTTAQAAGKSGHHSGHLEHLLAEMQVLQRSYPGGSW